MVYNRGVSIPLRFPRAIPVLIIAVALLVLFTQPEKSFAANNKFNMSFIYFGNSSTYTYYVDRTKNSLDEISPNYFNINEDGSLKLTDAFSPSFVKEMHDRGIKVVPFLSNHWDDDLGRAALRNGGVLAAHIAQIVELYGLDGVHVDIENLNETDRDAYTEFVRQLRNALPQGKTLAIAVAPNPWSGTTGWQGSYDYRALGEICDYIMIMAYDEHWDGSVPGAVASYPFDEKSIKYALEYVPKEKIVLGLPFYGRMWSSDGRFKGQGISLNQIEKIISENKGKVTFDALSGTPNAVVKIPAGKNITVFGKKLGPATYTFWYENEQSIKQKLKLVQKYDLKGTGSWSLGQETAETWDYYKLWLNAVYFSDVEGSWAMDSIMMMKSKGWMSGDNGSTFRPESALTRAEAAAIIVRALGLNDWNGSETFKDISDHWAKKTIEIAAQHGIVKGTGNGRFSPDDVVTRQEMAVMLDRITNPAQTANVVYNPYKDVNMIDNPWSYRSIVNLSASGLLKGYSDGRFRPFASITRAEMASLMSRASTAYAAIFTGGSAAVS